MQDAMLSYADAYHIYKGFDKHHSQKGVCLANMAACLVKMSKYSEAIEYF